MQTLEQFVTTNLGQRVGDGQCVALIEAWLDALGKPRIGGNAKDLLDIAPTASYAIFRNNPTNFPMAGDIVVWDGSWGAGYGHTGVVCYANVMHLVVFEQNDPYGSGCLVATHDYSGVAGWLRVR